MDDRIKMKTLSMNKKKLLPQLVSLLYITIFRNEKIGKNGLKIGLPTEIYLAI
jgi:hypothetical protein